MVTDRDPNLALLEEAAVVLGSLLDELLLVGGCAAGLLVTDPGTSPIRPTEDVDLVVEATTYADFQRFSRRLEALGFRQGDVRFDPLCRFRRASLVLDLMPLDEGILGFSNRWYTSALQAPVRRRLPSGEIAHVDAPHFLATKLEAFGTRGQGDSLTSPDLEDAVVIDGRPRITEELSSAPDLLRRFVSEGVAACLRSSHFVEALPGYFSSEPNPGARAGSLLERLRHIAGGGPDQ